MVSVFFEIHSNLPREGPGDDESTRKAYLVLHGLPTKPRILDIGCGPGMQTIALSEISNGRIDAVDSHRPFLDNLRRRLEEPGKNNEIRIVNGDMRVLPYADGSFDLIWSEGAIFIVGFEKGLSDWRRLLPAKGYIVVSELSWLKPDPPEEVRNFLANVYPALETVEKNLEAARTAGYCVLGFFILSEKSWWDNYYRPIEKKIPVLKSEYEGNEEALAILAVEELEIDMFRRYSDYYGYVFYILQKNPC